MITAKRLRKVYRKEGREIVAVDNISLEIPAGDFVSIVGPSGSGKSSLLLMLGGMLSPSQGEVFIEKDSIYDLDTNARAALRQKKIGFLFQTFNLIPYLTALQNVQMPLLLSGCDEKEQKEKAEALLERVGLKDRMDHKPSELSVGQQQRIALARMLANDPTLILADELTGNLDPKMTQHVINFLLELNQEKRTIVLVTHDRQVAQHAKRCLHIAEGGKLLP